MVFGTGPKAGEPLVKHPDVALISFTGSTLTGKRIYEMASENYKKLSLEVKMIFTLGSNHVVSSAISKIIFVHVQMGGKNAAIIFDDADLDQCISVTIR